MSERDWLHVFAYVVYAIAIVLLWMTYRRDGLFYAAMPVVFFVYFLVSELFATQGGLPYRYGGLPQILCVDLGALAPLAEYFFGTLPPVATGNAATAGLHTCPIVRACVPLSVPMMEAMLVFGALRTSMVLGVPKWFQPFGVALACVVLDWILDPTSAVSEWCGIGFGPDVLARGIEFWRWFIWGHYRPSWHGIPLINFGAWYFGTVGITTAALTVLWIRTTFFRPGPWADLGSILLTLIGVLLLGLHLEKLAFEWMGALFESAGAAGQWGFLAAWGLATALVARSLASGLARSPIFYWEWLLTPALLLLSSFVGLVFGGPHAWFMLLLAVWLLIVLVELAYALWPYRP